MGATVPAAILHGLAFLLWFTCSQPSHTKQLQCAGVSKLSEAVPRVLDPGVSARS